MLNRKDAETLGKGVIRLIVLGVFALLTFGVIKAQDELPKPPDPKTIFVPGVEVIETSPVLNFDNTTRQIQYFDPALLDWKSYPYPSELSDEIVTYVPYGPEKYLLLTKLTKWYRDYPNFRDISPEYFWIFDGTSGMFSRPQTQCEVVRAPLGEGRWIIRAEQSGKVFCNTETGETTKPLPEKFTADSQCQSPLIGGQAAPTPDSKWLIYFDCPPEITVYSYEFQTSTTRSLGILANTEHVGINGWFEDKNIILYTYNKSLNSLPAIYIADITQPDSLSFIADYPTYNAPKFYWNELKEDPKSSSTSLEIYSYNITTKARSELLKYVCGKTPKDCISGLTIVNKVNTRVAIMNYPSGTSGKGLVVYDLLIQKRIYESKAQVLSELQILWANDDTLIYFDGFDGYKASLHIVKFDSNGVSDDLIENAVHAAPVSSVLSPDGKFLILSSKNRVQIKLIDTGKIIPIAQINDEHAQFFAGWNDNKNLFVQLFFSSPFLAYSWKIQIPDGLVAA